jgi:hypothetical protein
MNNPRRLVGWNCDYLKQAPCSIGTNDEEPLFALKFVFHKPHRVSKSMKNVCIIDPMLSS